MALADFKPVILPDGTLGPSKEEREYAENRRAEGALLELNKKYEDLNRAAKEEARQSYVSSGMTPPAEGELARQGSSSLLTKMQKKPEDTSMPTQLAPSAPVFGQPEMEKEKPAEPVPPSGGTVPSVPPLDSSLADKISQGEKGKEVEQSDINKALTETLKLQQALGAGEKVDRSKLDGFLNELESIKIPERTSDPNAERFLQQRAEAYRAYQRKADRNEWLDLAQSLVNSITQFASAQAAMGTRFAGGQIPLAGVDYAGRTARAAKEYEMELGGVEAAERASAKKYEQDFLNEKDKMEGKKTGLLAKISAEKDALDEAQRTASAKQQQSITLFKLITDAKLEDAKVTATKNKLAEDVIADQKKQTKETVKTNINSLEDEAKKLQNQLAAANALAAGNIKDKDDNKVKLANALQLPVDTIETLISQQEGFFAGTKMQNYAKGIAADTQTKLTQINSSLNKLRGLSGEGAPATVTPPTPSTTPPPSGTIKVRDITPNSNKYGTVVEVPDTPKARELIQQGKLELVK